MFTKVFTKIFRAFVVVAMLGAVSLLMSEPPAIWGAKYIVPNFYANTMRSYLRFVNRGNASADINATIIDQGTGTVYENVELATSLATNAYLSISYSDILTKLSLANTSFYVELYINSSDVAVSALTLSTDGTVSGDKQIERVYLLTNP